MDYEHTMNRIILDQVMKSQPDEFSRITPPPWSDQAHPHKGPGVRLYQEEENSDRELQASDCQDVNTEHCVVFCPVRRACVTSTLPLREKQRRVSLQLPANEAGSDLLLD